MALHSIEASCFVVKNWGQVMSFGCLDASFQRALECGVLSCKVAAAITAAGTLNIKHIQQASSHASRREHSTFACHSLLVPFFFVFFYCCCPWSHLLFPIAPLSSSSTAVLSSLVTTLITFRCLQRRTSCTQIHTYNQPLCVSSQTCFFFSFFLLLLVNLRNLDIFFLLQQCICFLQTCENGPFLKLFFFISFAKSSFSAVEGIGSEKANSSSCVVGESHT